MTEFGIIIISIFILSLFVGIYSDFKKKIEAERSTNKYEKMKFEKKIADLEKEIVFSAKTIEERLRSPVDHFSFTFGDLASFSEAAFLVARKKFRFIHSGLRGDNAIGVSPLSIRRDSAARQDSHFNYSIFSNNLLSS